MPALAQLLTDLAAAGAGDLIRPALAGDGLDGVAAGCVGEPRCLDELSALLRAAAAMGLAVGVRGAGTKLGWGNPPERLDLLVDMAGLGAVVEHAAADQVVTVQAGTPLSRLQAHLAVSGQRLALDPPEPGATIGGIVATGASGPLRHLHRSVGGLVLGMTVVLADGTVARSGSKVVKNVAGYDLGKLFTGSYGTLGVIAELILRLHPLPETARWVEADISSPDEAAALVRRVARSQLLPAAVELDWPELGRGGATGTLRVLLEGAAGSVDGRGAALVTLLGADARVLAQPVLSAAPGVRPWQPGGISLKVATERSGLAPMLGAIGEAAAAVIAPGERGAHLSGQAGSGVLYVGLPPLGGAAAAETVRRLRAEAAQHGGTVVVLGAPPELKAVLDVWGPVKGLELMRRVKERFDPDRRMSPGRFVGGI
ncbi:MAG: FAD-binding oxidoreductase [Acidimicrobiales bacterium]